MHATQAPFGSHSVSAAELKEQLEAERQGQAFLVLRDDAGVQRIVMLPETATRLTVGRSPDTDIALSWDPEVSGVHAELERVGPEWTIADDGLSRNGTFVNGDRVSGRLRLRGGDVLCLGSTHILFRSPGHSLSETRAGGPIPRPSLTEGQRRVLIALCRPYRSGVMHGAPATNRQIADELTLSIEGVKTHLRALFERFDVEDLPQNRKRARLVELALRSGVIGERDLAP